MIGLTIAAWAGGGALFAHSVLTNPAARPVLAANSRALIDDLVRLRSAALVALVLFIAVWPVVFVGAHIAKLRDAVATGCKS